VFFVVAVVNWWKLTDEEGDIWIVIPAVGFTVAFLLIVTAFFKKRKTNGDKS
jgi:phosphate/sulfate permease